jgi:hypothetical protein
MGHRLWWEDGSVVYNCCLGLSSTLILGSKSHRTHDHILLSQIWGSQPGRSGPCIYFPQEQGNQVIHPGIGLSNSNWSWGYVITDSRSASLSCCQAPMWGPLTDFYYCRTVVCMLMWCALFDEILGLQCWALPAHSFSGLIPSRLITIFYSLKFETPSTWRAMSRYLYPPGTGWPSYIPRHWVPFSFTGLQWRYSLDSCRCVIMVCPLRGKDGSNLQPLLVSPCTASARAT